MKLEYDGATFVFETRGFLLTVFFDADHEWLDEVLPDNVVDWKLFRCRIVGESLKQTHSFKQTETATTV